jgi:hypothetical protein
MIKPQSGHCGPRSRCRQPRLREAVGGPRYARRPVVKAKMATTWATLQNGSGRDRGLDVATAAPASERPEAAAMMVISRSATDI